MDIHRGLREEEAAALLLGRQVHERSELRELVARFVASFTAGAPAAR